MAVVKADGYGHGLLRVARALEDSDGFAVLNVSEAIQLRDAGFRQPILLLEGIFSAAELPLLTEYGLSAVVHCDDQLSMLRTVRLSGSVDIFLKLNTGMNRLGFSPHLAPALVAQLQDCRAVQSVTLMTHFASADEAQGVEGPMEVFRTATRDMVLPVSLANSAALLRHPETRVGWVRPGIMLYGATPFPDLSARKLGLKPAMTMSSAVIGLQEIEKGGAVGYGGTFVADRKMRIGVVACGYADGYPRHAPTGTPILVAGRLGRTVGRVSMDMLTVDLTEVPEAGIGAPVELWGPHIPVDEVARAAGTIGYELLCARAERVPVTEV